MTSEGRTPESEQLGQREASLPPDAQPRVDEARQRLVDLYNAWGKPEQAAKWDKPADQPAHDPPPVPDHGR